MQRKKNIFFLLLFLVFLNLIQAQVIRSSATFGLPTAFVPLSFVMDKSSGTSYLVSATAEEKTGLPSGLHIQVFDKEKLNVLNELSLPEVFNNRFKFYPERVLCWNDSLRIFGSLYNKEEKTHELWLISLSKNMELLPQRKFLSVPASEMLSNAARFMFQTSDKGGFLSVSSMNKGSSPDEQIFYHRIYDANGALVKEIDYEPDYPVDSFHENKILLDEAGNLYMTLRALKSKSSANNRNYLYAFPILDTEVIQYELDIPGKEITDVIISLDADDHIQAAGIFKERFQKDFEQSGIFFLRIDRDQQRVLSTGIHLMDGKVSGLYLGNDNSPRREIFSHFKVLALLNASDTGVFLAIEEQKTEEICETDPRTGLVECNTGYFFGDIWYFKLSPNGDLDWLQKISKANHGIQTAYNFLGSSVTALNHRLLFFTNQPLNKGGAYRIPGFMSTFAKSQIIKDAGGLQSDLNDNDKINAPIHPALSARWNESFYFISQPEKSGYQLNIIQNK